MNTVTSRSQEIESVVGGILSYLKTEKQQDVKTIVSRLNKLVHAEKHAGEVITAFPIDQEKIILIEQILSEKFKTYIKLENVVKPSIIGGLIVKIGDTVIDQSLQTTLNVLEKKIYGSHNYT